MSECSISGCGGGVYARGMCGKHYQQDRRRVVTDAPLVRECRDCAIVLPPELNGNQLFCDPCGEKRRKARVAKYQRERRKAKRMNSTWRLEKRDCAYCGLVFIRGERKAANSVTCSDSCSYNHKLKRVRTRSAVESAEFQARKPIGRFKDCVVCGARFELRGRATAVKTCSDVCHEERVVVLNAAAVREAQEAREAAAAGVSEAVDWDAVLERIAASSGPETALRARDSLLRHRQLAGAA